MESGQVRARERSRVGETVLPDLVLVDPDLAAEDLRRFAPSLWPDDDLHRPPAGYREISSAFHGVRAFCRADLEAALPPPDPGLAARVREWVDALAHQWGFPQIFGVGELDFWAFFRDGMIGWMHDRMTERRVIEALSGSEPLTLLAIGLGGHDRTLMRILADASDGRLRPEIAYLEPPAARAPGTATERRMRKLFFMLQDGWHGVKLLAEDLFVRRPKVLFVSDARGWRRGRGRTVDVHLEGVWREARQRPLRAYYRTGNYHPDVGVMTSGRLAPTYLAQFLFLLAQTSRGFWELWRIHRQWRALREKPEFRDSLVCEGLPVAPMVLDWLDQQTQRRLPQCVRATRREVYFLRGVRPRAVLLTYEQGVNRPVLMAAKRLGIPTAALQLRPLHAWDHAYLLSRHDPARAAALPDRLCVFSQSTKAFLVEQGAFDPSAIVVTGDPRREGAEPGSESVARMRRRWGVEGGRRVVGIACTSTKCPELLAWTAAALEGRDDAFVLLVLSGGACAPGHGLRWCHALAPDSIEDWREGVDILITTEWTEAAEGVARRLPSVLVAIGEGPALAGPDAGALVSRAADPDTLRLTLAELLARPGRLPADEAWRAYIRAVYGEPDGHAAQRVMELLESLLRGA